MAEHTETGEKNTVQAESHDPCGVIRQYEKSDFFIWKHLCKEVCAGATLIVEPETEAYFVCNRTVLCVFESGTYVLSAQAYPAFFQGGSALECAVYFVHLDQSIPLICNIRLSEMGWDPAMYPGMPEHVLCWCTVQIRDSGKLMRNLIGDCAADSEKMQSNAWILDLFQYHMDHMIAYAVGSVFEETWSHSSYPGNQKRQVRDKIGHMLDAYGIQLVELTNLHLSAGKPDTEQHYYDSYEPEMAYSETVYTAEEPHVKPKNNRDWHENEEASPAPAKKRGFGFGGAISAGFSFGETVIGGVVDLFQNSLRKKTAASVENKTIQHEIQEDMPPKKTVEIQKVRISAIAPKKFIKGDYSCVNIILYEDAFRDLVDALKTEDDLEKIATADVPDNARIRVYLSSPDVEIPDNDQEAQWYGEYLPFSFGVFLPVDYHKPSIWFRARVYINGVLASNLSFQASCVSKLEQKLEVIRQDVLSAFVSYASEERDEVLRMVQGMRKARSDMEIFMDVEGLRSGDDWEKRLYCEIDRRDILYLCWSRAAKKSQWVDREWRYALKQKGEEGVDPLPLEPAEVCPPPEELDKKHFNDALIYLKKNRNW